ALALFAHLQRVVVTTLVEAAALALGNRPYGRASYQQAVPPRALPLPVSGLPVGVVPVGDHSSDDWPCWR
ncbi:hypothetical protein GW17_00014694, partial [Ensete ventricosum]